jgi:hypothetical protein
MQPLDLNPSFSPVSSKTAYSIHQKSESTIPKKEDALGAL